MNNSNLVKKIIESNDTYPKKAFTVKGMSYTCINPFGYHLIRKNITLFEQMDGLFVDGMIMAKLVSWYNGHSVRRLSFDMTGIALDLFERLNNNEESIYFIGARQNEVERTICVIKNSYPKLNIKGFRNGYFVDNYEKQKVLEEIVELNPDFVVIGMGTPKQEMFSLDLKKAGFKGISFTCGGFLHQTITRINYYPDWVNRFNLRAFYRLAHEKNLAIRLKYVLFHFPIFFTWDTILTKFSKSSSFVKN